MANSVDTNDIIFTTAFTPFNISNADLLQCDTIKIFILYIFRFF